MKSLISDSHLHLYDPLVLLHKVLLKQLCAPVVHSSTSEKREIQDDFYS